MRVRIVIYSAILTQNVFLFSRAGSLNGFHLDLPKNPVLEKINDRAESLTTFNNIRRRFDLHRLPGEHEYDTRNPGRESPALIFCAI